MLGIGSTQTNAHEQNLPSQTSSMGWGGQLSKSLILATSAVGLGWLVGKIWKGSNPELQEDQMSHSKKGSLINFQTHNHVLMGEKQIPSFMRADETNPFQKTDIAFRTVYGKEILSSPHQTSTAESDLDLSCYFGMIAGGTGSLLTSNPFPLLLGASLCSPVVHAESIIPDETDFRKQQIQNGVVDGVRFAHALTWTAAGALGGGIIGAGVGFVMGAAVDLMFSSYISKSEIIRRSVKARIEYAQNELAKNPNFHLDPSQERLKLTHQILGALSDPKVVENADLEMPFIRGFLSETQNILAKEIESRKTLQTTLTKMGNENANHQTSIEKLRLGVKNLQGHYADCEKTIGQINLRLDSVTQGSASNAQDISKLAHASQTAFDSAFQEIHNIKLDAAESKILTNLLVKEALIISTQGFEANKNIMNLEIEMRNLESVGKHPEALRKVNELKKAMQDENDKRQKFDQNLRGIAGGLEVVSAILSLIDPKIGRIAGTIGQSAVTIAASIATLAGLGTAAGAMTGGFAVLGPIGAIAGALYSIVNLFNTGPTMDQLILDAVQQLHDSLNKFRKEVHERFDHIEGMIIAHNRFVGQYLEHLDRSMHKRFDHILEVMVKFQEFNVQQFIDLKNVAAEIKVLAVQLKNQMDTIEQKIDINFRTLYQANYLKGRLYTLKFHERFPYPENNMSKSEMTQSYSDYADWAITGVINPLLTGPVANNDLAKVAGSVKIHGIDSNIQSLAAVAATFDTELAKFSNLPNPFLWADAVDTFLEFIFRIPEFKVTKNHRNDFESIRATGENFQNFVKALQTSPNLFKNLISNYADSIRHVQRLIQQVSIETLQKRNKSFTEGILNKKVESVTLVNLASESEALIKTLEPFSPELAEIAKSLASHSEKLKSFINTDLHHRMKDLESWLKSILLLVDKAIPILDDGFVNSANFIAPSSHLPGGRSGLTKFEWLKEMKSWLQIFRPGIEKSLSHTIKNLPIEAKKLELSPALIKQKVEQLKNKVDQFLLQLQEMSQYLNKASAIEKSKEEAYVKTQRTLEALSSIQPGIFQVKDIRENILNAASALKQKGKTYQFLMHHLNDEEREAIKSAVQIEFANEGSEIDKAMKSFDTYHVLLEAFVKLAFNREFQTDFSFRRRFENVWSIKTIRNSIQSWESKVAQNMTYIQIEDQALPFLEDLNKGIYNKISEIALSRNETLKFFQQASGHHLVDSAQLKLDFFENIWIEPTNLAHKPNATNQRNGTYNPNETNPKDEL